MKKVDLEFLRTTDFDALLRTAQEEYLKYLKESDTVTRGVKCEGLSWPVAVQASCDAARERWRRWVRENINDKGLRLTTNLGAPTSISCILATTEYSDQ